MEALKITVSGAKPDMEIEQIKMYTDDQLNKRLDDHFTLSFLSIKGTPNPKVNGIDIYLNVDGIYDKDFVYVDIDYFDIEEFFKDIVRIECITQAQILDDAFTIDVSGDVERETDQFRIGQTSLSDIAFITI